MSYFAHIDWRYRQRVFQKNTLKLMSFKILSWNVNSINVRCEQVVDLLRRESPDVLCLQELKCVEEKFPREPFEALGYHMSIAGEKTYNGVAIISKAVPVSVAQGMGIDSMGVGDGEFDRQKRVLVANFSSCRVMSVYVPNGESTTSEKYAFKLRWLAEFHSYLKRLLVEDSRVIVCGDFNIAPEDRDVWNPEHWRDKVLCSEAERMAWKEIIALGFVDTFRMFNNSEGQFSWWDYRSFSFRRKQGLRIDFILASQAVASSVISSEILVDMRKLERPSDHAPLMAVFG